MTEGGAAKPVKSLSVVIPTYKSEENLPVLVERLQATLSPLPYAWEIILVDDGSPDDTLPVLRGICARHPGVRVLSLSRNFGQQIAASAGLRSARGDAVVIMDDDLQDPPEFIPTLVEKWEQGYDVVYAVRTRRKEGLLKRTAYRAFYDLLAGSAGRTRIPKDSGDFGLMDRKVVEALNAMPERSRFVRGLRAWAGFRQIGVDCERAARHRGRPAYGWMKMLRLSLDGLFSFSDLPLKISSTIGFVVSGFAFLAMAFTFAQKVATVYFPSNPLAVWPGFSTIVLAILFLGGVQLICIGILGEYIARIYAEVKQRPLFLVKERINFEQEREELPAARQPERPAAGERGRA